MELRIVIADNKAPRVLEAMCSHFGYQATINGTPNPVTEAQFAREQVKAWIREIVRTHEERAAVDTARATVAADVLTF